MKIFWIIGWRRNEINKSIQVMLEENNSLVYPDSVNEKKSKSLNVNWIYNQRSVNLRALQLSIEYWRDWTQILWKRIVDENVWIIGCRRNEINKSIQVMLEEDNSLFYPDSVDEKKVKVLERKLDLQSQRSVNLRALKVSIE